MTKIKIHIEGGGNSRSTQIRLREGFDKFFGKVLNSEDVQPVMGGGNSETIQLFEASLADPNIGNTLCFILLDSDQSVTHSPKAHIRQHIHRKQRLPEHSENAPEDRFHLMVQIMESWFLADISAIRGFYGDCFDKSAFSVRDDVEAISKSQVYDELARATCACEKPYDDTAKIRHAAELLKAIDPKKVRKKAKHCDYLLISLEYAVANS